MSRSHPESPRLVAPYPLFSAQGSPRELGRQHGEQAHRQIAAHLAFLEESLKLTRRQLEARALGFRPLFTQHCPQLLEEIEALAEGAGIAPAAALAVNVRAALDLDQEGGCSAFALAPGITAGGSTLIGQTSDTLPIVQDLAYVLKLYPQDRPALLMWTFGGMIGYHGFNEHGVAHMANDLGGGPGRRFAMPHYPFKRLLLECRDLNECLALFGRIPLSNNGNYVLSDGTGRILTVEATAEGVELLEDEDREFLVHTNHFLGAGRATPDNHARSAPDSFTRQQRLEYLIRHRGGKLGGKLTVADLQGFLHDRENHPTAICRDARQETPESGWEFAGITVAAIVAEPENRLLHIAPGNDPATAYHTYSLER